MISDKVTHQVNRKLAVLGDRAIGKSSLIRNFMDGKFSDRYEPTIETTHRKMLLFQRICFQTDIIDTAGMDDFYRLQKNEFYRLSRNASVGVDGYILAYSVTSKSSFDKLKSINNVLFNMLGDPPAIPRVLVGTMLDLKEQRVVSREQAQSLANEWKIPYIECSAKDSVNVGEAFYTLMMEIEKDGPLVQTATTRAQCVIV